VFGQLESHGKRDMEREKMRMHPIYDKGNKKLRGKGNGEFIFSGIPPFS